MAVVAVVDASADFGILARTFVMAVFAVVTASWNLGILAMGTAITVYFRAAKMRIEESPNHHVQLDCVEVGDVLTGPLSGKVKGFQEIVVKTWLYTVRSFVRPFVMTSNYLFGTAPMSGSHKHFREGVEGVAMAVPLAGVTMWLTYLLCRNSLEDATDPTHEWGLPTAFIPVPLLIA
jgi:hypothetical protein